MWSDWKEQIEHQPKVRRSLLWEEELKPVQAKMNNYLKGLGA